MKPYSVLSIAQFFFIFICGFSVLDYGVMLSELGEDDNTGLGFNDLLFGDSESGFWNSFAFWGYCMMIVAILQLVKAFTVDDL